VAAPGKKIDSLRSRCGAPGAPPLPPPRPQTAPTCGTDSASRSMLPSKLNARLPLQA